MALFRRNDKEKEELERLREELRERDEKKLPSRKKFKDLAPQNKKKRKEPPKPWGRVERLIIVGFLGGSILVAGILALSARDWKLPGLPRLYIPSMTFENTVILEASPTPSAKFDGVKKSFGQSTEKLSGVYGLYVSELNSGEEYGVYEKEVFPAAELMSLPVILALYQEEEKGRISLDDKYTLEETDKISGSGLFKKPAGTELSYRELARLIGKESDSTAFEIVRKKLGDRKIQETINSIGMIGTTLGENETTPKDIGKLFVKLWKNDLTTPEHKDEILGYLTATAYEDWLKAGVPKAVRVAHVYGRETHVVNDGGIVFWEEPYVVVILSKGVVETEADRALPQLSRTIYNFEVAY